MTKALRFALVGCGAVATRHAEQMNRVGQLVACCDTNKNKADAFAANFGGRSFSSMEALLKDERNIDVVSICTPNGLHAQHSIQAMKAGFHVLCEKPMALSVADCREMIEISAGNERLLFIVKQNRFNPPVVAVKKLLDEQRLGKIYSVQVNGFWNRGLKYYEEPWKASKSLSGGTLFAQFSHFVDLLYWLNGDISWSKANMMNYAHNPLVEFEDTGVVNLRFENGSIGAFNFTVNSYQKNMEGSITIFAEKGTIKIGGEYLNTLEYQNIQDYTIPSLPAGKPANEYGFYQGSMSNHDKVYDNLVAVINGNAKIATSGLEGLKTVEIIEKIYQSASAE